MILHRWIFASKNSNHAALSRSSLPDKLLLSSSYHHRWFSSDGNTNSSTSSPVLQQMAYIAVGSNMGDRFQNIMKGLSLLSSDPATIQIKRTSFLYETKPMYFTNQPSFLNGAIQIHTNLNPQDLLTKLKSVEQSLGRYDGTSTSEIPRGGPRPLDLDILLYYNTRTNSSNSESHQTHPFSSTQTIHLRSKHLQIPHPRIQEREFVLQPMLDLDPLVTLQNKTMYEWLQLLKSEKQRQDDESCVRVLPLPRGRMLRFNETIVMGILNVTPDSFSDGGKLCGSIGLAVKDACQMVTDGATIVDIGGESTRPGALEVELEEELQRTIPVVRSLRSNSPDIVISIDTRRAAVAQAAIKAGADIVNDVSGGTFDKNMFSTVASLQVPYIMMHMRGTPKTMQQYCKYEQDDVVFHVANSLVQRSMVASEEAGLHAWLQILDPGIGFAKDLDGNLSLIKHFSGKFRQLLQKNYPILIGPSRKGFIGHITGETNPSLRDFGTAAACVAALLVCPSTDGIQQQLPTIVRVHNVKDIKQAMQTMDAINRAK